MSARNMAKRTAAGTLALAVCLGGGAIALASAASADANFKFDTRIAGDDRYGTAIAASKAAFDKADNVILVNGYATVDGLTASYLAGVANAPILYVSDKGADDATKAEIKRLGAKNIWLVGGEKVIPTSVETAIKGDGYNVTRINGSDRYETAKLIAEAGTKISGKKPAKVFVASGTSFADALAVSPIAFNKGYAIALTEKDSTSDYTKQELGAIGTDAKILVGGEAVVSKKVQADLSIKDEMRIAGADRAVTANLVSDWAKKSEGFNPANAALVGGTNGNGADSLVAAPLGGKSFTTLHFAGWDATNVYLKDHAAELTGKGFVFGGKAAVPGDQVDKAQSAAQSVAAAKSYVVTTAPTGNKLSFGYADSDAGKQVTATFAATDTFVVDGVKATSGAFYGALSIGDVVSVTPASGSAPASWSLVSKTTADYNSGMVGSVNTQSGNGNHNYSIIEPVTGTTLSVTGGIDYTGTYTTYTVDGQAVSQALFEGSLSTGDQITVSGKNTLASPRVVALKSASVVGTVASADLTNGKITIKVGDAVLGSDPATATAFFIGATTDNFSIDGATASKADFFSSTAPVNLTVGDKITYSRAGGLQTFALVNAAPSSVSGVVTLHDASGFSYLPQKSGTAVAVTYAAGQTYIVDGAVASQAEFIAAASSGDWITMQSADTVTNTKASFSITSKPLAGTVLNSSVSGTSFDVMDDSATPRKLATVDAGSATNVFASATSAAYTVDGTTKTKAQFASVLSQVSAGSLNASVQVSISGGVATYALATTPFTAAPAPTALTASSTSNPTKTTLTFNKPIQGAPGAAAWASTDITVTSTGTAPTFSSATITNGQLVITWTGNVVQNDKLTIGFTSAGAAKATDVSGTIATTDTVTGTIS